MYPRWVSEHEAVWAETTGGGLLRDLFGHYPTLEDARIRSLSYSGDWAEMHIDYRETEEGAELAVKITLTWAGQVRADLEVEGNELLSMRLLKRGGLVRAEFETGVGVFGFVEGERFDARLEKLDPPKEGDEVFRMRVRLG